jgi:peptide/nickel transport system substrate-binding protein
MPESTKRNNRISNISRRDFLRFAGLTVAGSMVPLSINGTAAATWGRPSQASRYQQGVELVRVGWGAPITLDPARLSADSEVALVNAIYDYLIDTDAGSNLIPRLAQSWTVSDDGLQYTLNLVENAVFHDGSPFSADDVVWTFNRLRDPDQSNAADFFGNIENVEAVDPATVVFTLTTTSPDFLFNLTDNRAVILQANTEDPASAFNGTGPFKMVSFDAEDRAVMEANENYWLEGAPSVQNLEFIYFSDPNASVNALADGSVDIILRMSTSVFQSLQQDFLTIDIPTNGYNLVRLRTDRGPGTNPDVFRAMRLATDRAIIFDLIAGGFGALAQDHPIGPLYSQFHDPDVAAPTGTVDEIRSLLADAGYPDGIELDLHYPNSGDRPDLADAFRSLWADVGININLRPRDEAIYYSDVEDNWLSVDLGMTGWGSRPTPQQYLDLQLKTGAVWNEAHYSNPELDELIERAGSSLDMDIRVEAYQEIQQLLANEGPLIIPYFFPQFAALREGFDNFRLHPFAGRSDFRFITSG